MRKIFIIFDGICLIIVILGLFFLKLKNFHIVLAQEQLSCIVQSSACSGDKPVEIFQMSNITNAHAALPGQSYNYHVCCGGITGLGNSCSGNYAVVLKLSGQTNAHVQQTGSYPQNACISAPSGNTISVAYRSGSCNSNEINLASMSASDNAHVGDSTAYATKICVKIEPVIVSISVSDGLIDYGIIPANSNKSTCDLNDTQIITNNSNITINLNIKGTTTTCWSLGNSPGNEVYVHKFTTSSCPINWNNAPSLTTDYQSLFTGLSQNATTTLNLQITTPTSTTCFSSQSVSVIIQAIEP